MNTLYYPSLELCKKLTELGFPEKSGFYFQGELLSSENQDYFDRSGGEYINAPSVMEMLEFIRCVEGLQNHEFGIRINHVLGDKYNVEYQYSFGPKYPFQDTLPNALAKMCIWLHENGFISFDI